MMPGGSEPSNQAPAEFEADAVSANELVTEPFVADDYADVVAALAAAIPAVAPPTRVKCALLERLDHSVDPRASDRRAMAALPGFSFHFAEDNDFVATPYPGIRVRILHVDPIGQHFSALLKMDPQSSFPSHAHDGLEECLVLGGELLVGGVRMRVGDYQLAQPCTVHVEQRSVTGALLYIRAPISLLDASPHD
jgi:hypothetical protein